ncbi:uncharacterized protein G2W53_032800 [Senna tora]|uniref:Uncharacterized protein n=1 Tax=Senna tora TaxID=362788 RepID=A0A834SXC5_9FABA|nr:uncharacterized protein G2W53_032800 [Senna tora]
MNCDEEIKHYVNPQGQLDYKKLMPILPNEIINKIRLTNPLEVIRA